MLLKIGTRHIESLKANTLEGCIAQAMRTYIRLRDESGEGGSTFEKGIILIQDPQTGEPVEIFEVSYNGRVWPYLAHDRQNELVWPERGGKPKARWIAHMDAGHLWAPQDLGVDPWIETVTVMA